MSSLNKAQAISGRIFVSQAKPARRNSWSVLFEAVLEYTGTVYLTRTDISHKSWMAKSAPVPLVVFSSHYSDHGFWVPRSTSAQAGENKALRNQEYRVNQICKWDSEEMGGDTCKQYSRVWAVLVKKDLH